MAEDLDRHKYPSSRGKSAPESHKRRWVHADRACVLRLAEFGDSVHRLCTAPRTPEIHPLLDHFHQVTGTSTVARKGVRPPYDQPPRALHGLQDVNRCHARVNIVYRVRYRNSVHAAGQAWRGGAPPRGPVAPTTRSLCLSSETRPSQSATTSPDRIRIHGYALFSSGK